MEVLWRQYPKMFGYGHYGHRLLVDEDGYLWISSGDRQKFTPSQDMQSNVGKVLRVRDDASIPDGNPFADYFSENPLVDDIGVYAEIWSLGHRNPLGIGLDLDGQLWVLEMGSLHGDHYDRREVERCAIGARYARLPRAPRAISGYWKMIIATVRRGC